MNHWTIYCYTFPNQKRYVGATKRKLMYRQGSLDGGWKRYQNCRLLWPAIQEYGIKSINVSILFEGDISDEEAAEKERYYIALFKTNAKRYHDPSFGYNLGDGGEGLKQRHLSEERKEQLRVQLSEAQKTPKYVSDETRRRQSVAKLGTHRGVMSQETKDKISRANSRENMSEETHIKRSNAKKKQVLVRDHNGNDMIFESGEEAAKRFGVAGSMISRWISGERRPPAGYTFHHYSPTTTE